MFSLGIAVPIPNYKFDKPTFVSATLTNSVDTGGLSAALTAVSPVYSGSTPIELKYLLRRGDTLTLSSTHSSYSGYTEQVVIDKFSGSTVQFTEPLSYSYLAGNSVKGYGTGYPDGWIKSGISATAGDFYHTTMKPSGGGYSDDYGLYFLADKTASGSAQSLYASTKDFELPVFNEYCWYREGVWVRAYLTGTNTSLVLGSFSRQSSISWPSYVHRYGFRPTAENTWEEVSYTFKTAPVLTRYVDGAIVRTDRYGNVSLDINIDAANYSYAWVCIDDIYMEHIRRVAPLAQSLMNISVSIPSSPVSILVHNPTEFTAGNRVSVWGQYLSGNAMEGEINFSEGTIDAISGNRLTVSGLAAGYNWASGAMVEEKNTGVYTFEECPDQDVSWEPINNLTLNRTTNNGLKYANPSGWGERTTKVQITMKFTNVSYSFYKKLKKFEDECKKGNLLNLHQNGDLPELRNPFVQGFMQLTGFIHNIWDRTLCSFQLVFTEV